MSALKETQQEQAIIQSYGQRQQQKKPSSNLAKTSSLWVALN